MSGIRKLAGKINTDYGLFLLSGAFQYVLDILLFAVLVFFNLTPVHANIISRCVAACVGFFLNGFYVFGFLRTANSLSILQALVKFILLLVVMTFLSSFLINQFLLVLPESYILVVSAKVVVELFLAVLSFLIQKLLVFRKKN